MKKWDEVPLPGIIVQPEKREWGGVETVTQEEHQRFIENAKWGKLGQARIAYWLFLERGYTVCNVHPKVAQEVESVKKKYEDWADIGDIYCTKNDPKITDVRYMNGDYYGILRKMMRVESKQTKKKFTCAADFPYFEATYPYMIVVAKHRHTPHPRSPYARLPKPYCYIHLSIDGKYCAIMYSRDESKWKVMNIKAHNYQSYAKENYVMHLNDITWARLIDVKDP